MSPTSSGEPQTSASPIVSPSIARPLFWAAAAFAFVMAVIPNPPQLPESPSDKFQHIAAFLVLAALGRLAYPATRKRKLLLGLAAFGAIIEIAQAIPALHRDTDPLDWIADVAAATAVFAAIALWPRRKRNEDAPAAGEPE